MKIALETTKREIFVLIAIASFLILVSNANALIKISTSVIGMFSGSIVNATLISSTTLNGSYVNTTNLTVNNIGVIGQLNVTNGINATNDINTTTNVNATTFVENGLPLSTKYAPSGARYIVSDDLLNQLSNAAVWSDTIIIKEEFGSRQNSTSKLTQAGGAINNDTITYSVIGNDTWNTTDSGLYGVHNFNTNGQASGKNTEAGFSINPTQLTTNGTGAGDATVINASRLIKFETVMKIVNVSNAIVTIGLFSTNLHATSTWEPNGVFFNTTIPHQMNGTLPLNWTVNVCAGGNCNSNTTIFNVTGLYTRFTIRSDGVGKSFAFYINKTMVSNITSNRPPVNNSDFVSWVGATIRTLVPVRNDIRVDYAYLEMLRNVTGYP